MDEPFIKVGLVRTGPFDFWRTQLYNLRDAIYLHMDKTGTCPLCGQSANPHSEDCGFSKVEGAIINRSQESK